jgi:hypothetical protein
MQYLDYHYARPEAMAASTQPRHDATAALETIWELSQLSHVSSAARKQWPLCLLGHATMTAS